MSKIVAASCVAGVVTVGGLPVPGVTLLSEGVASSEGILIIDVDRTYYVTNIGNDLDTTLEKLIAALEKLSTALTKTTEGLGKAVDALTKLDTKGFLIAATAGVPSPPIAVTDILGITTASTAITTAVTELDAIKVELQTLKGNLA